MKANRGCAYRSSVVKMEFGGERRLWLRKKKVRWVEAGKGGVTCGDNEMG